MGYSVPDVRGSHNVIWRGFDTACVYPRQKWIQSLYLNEPVFLPPAHNDEAKRQMMGIYFCDRGEIMGLSVHFQNAHPITTWNLSRIVMTSWGTELL
jgi:hypothetical protein